MTVSTETSPRGALLSAIETACVEHLGDCRALDLQPHRPHEIEHLDDDRVRHLRFADDVVDDRLRVGRVRHLPAQQARHHLDSGERVLQLVRHRRRHFAERGEPIAQALALLELLDARQILEEQRRAARLAVVVADQRERIADDLAGRLQPQLDAIRQVAQFERAGNDPDDVVMDAQDVGILAADVGSGGRQPEDAIGLVVHDRQGALAGDCQHAVAHAVDHVAEEAVAAGAAAPQPTPVERGSATAPVIGDGPRRSEALSGISEARTAAGTSRNARAWPVVLHATRMGKAHARSDRPFPV